MRIGIVVAGSLAIGATISNACAHALAGEFSLASGPSSTLLFSNSDRTAVSGGVAGIDCQHSAGDVLRLVAEQELNRVGNVLNLRQPAERTTVYDLLALASIER